MRLRFHARQTRVHSFCTLSNPRVRNWRNPITDLMMPKTGCQPKVEMSPPLQDRDVPGWSLGRVKEMERPGWGPRRKEPLGDGSLALHPGSTRHEAYGVPSAACAATMAAGLRQG